MKFTWSHIIGFFATLALLGGLLYPRAVFLGLIYEGQRDLVTAEAFYTRYLAAHPFDRFTTLRLAALYNRMGEPDRATPLLRELSRYRRRDWDIAVHYLTHLEDRHAEMELLAARISIAHQFRTTRGIDHQQRIGLLEDALQQAIWLQLDELADALLGELLANAPEQTSLREWQHERALGQHHTDRVLAYLSEQVQLAPRDNERRDALLEVYSALERWTDIRELASSGLAMDPDHGGLLMRRAQALEHLGERQLAVADYEHAALANPNQELSGIVERLLALYQQLGQTDNAVRLLTQRLSDDPGNRELWRQGLALLRGPQHAAARKEWLVKAQQQFPNDTALLHELATTLLYDAGDRQAIALYRAYVQRARDLPFALDVAYALRGAPTYPQWLHTLQQIFPGDARIYPLLLAHALAAQQWDAALALLHTQPASAARNRQLADIYRAQGHWAQALYWYQQTPPPRRDAVSYWDTRLQLSQHTGATSDTIAALVDWAVTQNPQHTATWLDISNLLLVHDGCTAALPPLQQTFVQHATQPVGYALQQCLDATGHSRAATRVARQALPGSTPLQWNDAPSARIGLALASHNRSAAALRTAYAAALTQFPRDAALHVAYIDTLLNIGAITPAARALETTHDIAISDTDQRRLQARLALARGTCRDAQPLWNAVRAEFPNDISIAQASADCALAAGDYRSGLAQYDALSTPALRVRRAEVHRAYDAEVAGWFRSNVRGNDRSWESQVSTRSAPFGRWRISGDIGTGRYFANDLGLEQQLTRGRTRITYAPNARWSVAGGLAAGTGSSATAVTPEFSATAQWRNRLRWTADAAFRALRSDIARAVIAGTTQHRFQTDVTLQWTRRLYSALRYTWQHDTTNAGNHATTHEIQPEVSFQLLQNPDLSFGYAFAFSETTSPDAYFTEVPLIPHGRAHYLFVRSSVQLHPTVLLQTSAFLGHDTGRDLRFTRGDLFGIEATVRWDITQHLSTTLSAQIDRARELNGTAIGHTWQWGLTTHW